MEKKFFINKLRSVFAKTVPDTELFIVSDDGQDLVPASQVSRPAVIIPRGDPDELFVASADGKELVLESMEAFKSPRNPKPRGDRLSR